MKRRINKGQGPKVRYQLHLSPIPTKTEAEKGEHVPIQKDYE